MTTLAAEPLAGPEYHTFDGGSIRLVTGRSSVGLARLKAGAALADAGGEFLFMGVDNVVLGPERGRRAERGLFGRVRGRTGVWTVGAPVPHLDPKPRFGPAEHVPGELDEEARVRLMAEFEVVVGRAVRGLGVQEASHVLRILSVAERWPSDRYRNARTERPVVDRTRPSAATTN